MSQRSDDQWDHFNLIFGHKLFGRDYHKHISKFSQSTDHKGSHTVSIIKCPPVSEVPLPGAFLLFGSMLLAFVAFGKRKFVK
jgi:hypothetical protein